MTTHPTYLVADLFCGAGGSSSGARRALRAAGADMDLVAVNHWPVAVATHQLNHPEARHHCVDLDSARPEALVPEGRLDLLMASPECTHHSRARGGKPVSDQRRMSAWHVQRWASVLDVRCILVENVAEFRDWGPLLPSGKPDPAAKGLYFQAWVQALWGMGYVVDWRLLNAADFGDATTRVRFFLQARRDGLAIRWPEPSHARAGTPDLFGSRPRWRAARDVIDWDRPGGSLFDRRRPLSVKTRIRIARGLERFGGTLAPMYVALLDLPDAVPTPAPAAADEAPSPFVSPFRNHTAPRGPDDPLPTIVASNGSGGMSVVTPTAEPFVMANRANNVPRSVDEPTATMTTTPGGGGLYVIEPTAEPFVLGQQSGSIPRDTAEPLPTIATAGAVSLIEPSLIQYYGNSGVRPVGDPVPAIATRCHFGLCQPLVVPYGPRADARPVDQPLHTVTTKDRLAVAEPFLVPQFGERDGQSPRVRDVEAPLPAVTSHGAGCLVEPVVITTDQTGGNGIYARPACEPLPTLSTNLRLGVAEPTATPCGPDVDPRRLVDIDGVPHVLDIRFRMLSNRELARAMGFDDDEVEYEFTGNVGEVTRQIGNAVPVNTAAALVRSILVDGVAVEAVA